MSKKNTITPCKTSLLNDCTNHLAFQLKEAHLNEKTSKQTSNSLDEAPVSEIVTKEFIKGYN